MRVMLLEISSNNVNVIRTGSGKLRRFDSYVLKVIILRITVI
jgi:hypothetical protein